MRHLATRCTVALLAVLIVAGCAAKRYAEETYHEAGVAFERANGADISRWIEMDGSLDEAERGELFAALGAWRATPGVLAVDLSFDDSIGPRLETWASEDTSLSDLTRRAILQDIRSWRALVASRR